MNTLNQFFFGIYPYIAGAIFLLGSLVRFEREQYTWKSDSSQLLHRGQLRLGNILFHVGILGLFFGHLVGLLTPVVVWDALGVSHTFKQGVATAYRPLPGRPRQPYHGRAVPVQGAPVHGPDAVPDLPVHPAGAHLERLRLAGVPGPRLAAGAPALNPVTRSRTCPSSSMASN